MHFSEGGCDALFASRLLDTSCTVGQLAKELLGASQARERMVLRRYIAYMTEQRCKLDETTEQLASPLDLARSTRAPTAQSVAIGSLQSQRLPSDPNDVQLDHASFPRDLAWAKPPRRFYDGQPPMRPMLPKAVQNAPRRSMATMALSDAMLFVAPPWQWRRASILNVSRRTSGRRSSISAQSALLTANLLVRHPGEFASHDHTFESPIDRSAKRLLLFMIGEDHAIFWHGVKTHRMKSSGRR